MFKVRQMGTDSGLVTNQFVIEMDRFRVFQSYQTTIAIVDTKDGSITLDHDWDISRTTMRWLKKFLEDELRMPPPAEMSANVIREAIKQGLIQMRDINNREEK